MGKITHYAWSQIYYAFSQNNKKYVWHKESKKQGEAENERYGQVKQRQHRILLPLVTRPIRRFPL